jgi:hypothetical protein
MRTLTQLLIYLVLASLTACVSQNTKVLTPAAVREAPENYLILAVRNDAGAYAHTGSTARNYGGTVNYVESDSARRLLRAIASDYQLQAISGWPIPTLSLQCVIFKTNATTSREQVLAKLNQDTRVSLAQPLQSFTTNTLPNSDAGNSAVSHNDPYADMQANLTRMGINEAHHWSRGKGVRVAVVDTGVDGTHPDLQGRIGAQRNFVDNDVTQFRNDRHGTAVAGVIAANADNGIGMVGIAPEAKLFVLKACWQLRPDHDEARCNSFTLAQALESAIELQVHIINLSVVGPLDPLLAALVARAQDAGIIVVGALGATEGFPAQIANVVGVAAMEDATDSVRALQNVLHAPGRDVLTLMPHDRYDFSSGNSIATAEISGTIALLLASRDQAKSGKVDGAFLQRLLAQATAIGPNDKLSAVNACLALSQLTKQTACSQASLQLANKPQ